MQTPISEVTGASPRARGSARAGARWPLDMLLMGWSVAAVCAGLAHLFFPQWTAHGTTWQSEVHWQREVAYFDLLLACAFCWIARQDEPSLKTKACGAIACLSLGLGLHHLGGWWTAPKIFHVIFTLGNFLAVAWGIAALLHGRKPMLTRRDVPYPNPVQNASSPRHALHVGLVAEHQHESLTDLLCELHAFYNQGSAPSRSVVRAHLLERLLAPGSCQHLLVASRADGSVVGFAAISLVYSLVEFSADQRRQCQLKELYVGSSERSKGVGRALMSGVASYALVNGCHRIDWPVKSSNARGILFYEGLGAERVAERLSYRLTGPALGRLAHENGEVH